MEKTVVFYQFGRCKEAYIFIWDKKDYSNYAQVEAALLAAGQEYANKMDILKITLPELPEEIFQECKIKMMKVNDILFDELPVFRAERPVKMCGCGYCMHNRNGYCDERCYEVDDDDEACSRICWTHELRLGYEGEHVGYGFISDLDDPLEILRYILNSDDSSFDDEKLCINRFISEKEQRGAAYDERKWDTYADYE